MNRRPKYEIEQPGPGELLYREGHKEYRFPVFEEEGETVLVAYPTRLRIFLFFAFGGWTRVPREFSKADNNRIIPRIVQYLRSDGNRVRLMSPVTAEEKGLAFHPELFESRSRAMEILDESGFVWFSDYSSVDLLHQEYGLEICGIADEAKVERIAETMQKGFPHWHCYGLCQKGCGREPGWKFAIFMFPRGCC